MDEHQPSGRDRRTVASAGRSSGRRDSSLGPRTLAPSGLALAEAKEQSTPMAAGPTVALPDSPKSSHASRAIDVVAYWCEAATDCTTSRPSPAAAIGHRQSRGAAAADARLNVKAGLAAREARDPSFANLENLVSDPTAGEPAPSGHPIVARATARARKPTRESERPYGDRLRGRLLLGVNEGQLGLPLDHDGRGSAILAT
jgi:phage-related tail fiber protein